MKRVLQRIGTAAWWLCLPALMVYLSGGPRTRLVIYSGGKIVAVKGWLGNGKWSLPGGGLHKGEDPLVGVLREVREETGLELSPNAVRSLGVQEYRSYGMHFPCHYFSADLPEQLVLKPQPIEISETSWLDPQTLSVRNTNADVLTAIKLAGGAGAAKNTTV